MKQKEKKNQYISLFNVCFRVFPQLDWMFYVVYDKFETSMFNFSQRAKSLAYHKFTCDIKMELVHLVFVFFFFNRLFTRIDTSGSWFWHSKLPNANHLFQTTWKQLFYLMTSFLQTQQTAFVKGLFRWNGNQIHPKAKHSNMIQRHHRKFHIFEHINIDVNSGICKYSRLAFA